MAQFYVSPEGDRYYARRPFKYAGIQYTRAGATPALFGQLGFTPVTVEEAPDSELYTTYGVRNDGTYIKQPKSVDVVKERLITTTKLAAHEHLRSTDWQVIRSVEDPGKGIKQSVKAYRTAIRGASDAYEAAVTACTTLEDLAALGPVVWPEAPTDVPEDEPPA